MIVLLRQSPPKIANYPDQSVIAERLNDFLSVSINAPNAVCSLVVLFLSGMALVGQQNT